MKDGGMGGRFIASSSSKMAAQVAELKFRDSDGVDVIATLNLDEAGVPFDLDIWKTNFEPLICIPDFFGDGE